jgi:3-deoxy-D-manno-octulosonic-acid transferase
MYRLLYSALFYVAVPFICLRVLLRSLRAPAYRRRMGERFALAHTPAGFDRSRMTLWVHAVSVGESVAAAPLVHRLREQYPQAQILVTTMTPTGSDRVISLFGDKVYHRYIPYDLPGAVSRFLRIHDPTLLVLMETELWPNLIHQCHARGVRLLLANARLSERSARGYQRLGVTTRTMLQQIDAIAAQAEPDARRFVMLGADAARVHVTGSLKFLVDISAGEEKGISIFDSIRHSGRPVLLAASTRDGEEPKVLAAFRQCLTRRPDLLLLLIPRHPERFDRVARLCEEAGYRLLRRSSNKPVADADQIVLGDSMGEMLRYTRLATIAFVGGSLVNTGCQNVLEPAALGVPVITGPSQFNFATICRQLESAGALLTVQNADELAAAVIALLKDESRRQGMGQAGQTLVQANRNALPALMSLIAELLPAN